MKKCKSLICVLLSVIFVFLLVGCGENATAYEINNKEGYTVSVKFDANGGLFGDNINNTVVVDSFNIDGKTELALITPDDSQRGKDAIIPNNNGHFLAGWYKNRIEKTDKNGKSYFEYSGKWDFEKDVLKVDANKKYSADKPVLTLYAVWVPNFEIEFYSRDSGELLTTKTYNPILENEYSIPAWDKETGIIDMYKFPTKEGYTFNKAYYDAEGTKEITGETLALPTEINEKNPTDTKSTLKVYIDWTPGEWYHIYNADQFKECASVKGNYELFADLDFADEIWPTTLVYGNFSGVIKGNGYTIKNVKITQTNNSKINAGVFGYLTDTADISDLNFENITFTIKAGTRKVGTSYGLFAGTISDKANINGVNIFNSHLQIDSSAYFGVDDYLIGLVCGMGDSSKVSTAQIDCTATGDKPEQVEVDVSENTVSVVINK